MTPVEPFEEESAEPDQDHPESPFHVLKLVGRYEHGAFVPATPDD